jgi:cardiolipin synthase
MLATALLTACTKLPPDLTLPRLAITDPGFQNSLQAFTGAPIIGDNKVEILLNGNETFPAIIDAIRTAQKTVTFEAYIFRKSDVADQIIQAFVERCKVGVRVAVLLDAHGSSEVPTNYIDALRSAGCRVVPDFRPLRFWQPRRSNLRNHRRIVVVDGRIGFTGGYGIDEMWMGDGRTKGRWRETNVRLEGPIVQQLQAAFSEHWLEATGELLGGQEFYPYPPIAVVDVPIRAQVVVSNPTRDNFALYALFLQAVSSAERSILISTPYLLPGEQMTRALFEAVQRGVQVTVLVPAVIREALIEYLVQESHREGFGELLHRGLQLYEYEPALLHTKTMVIDGIWATVGTANLDNRSMGMNDELNVVLYDDTVARRMEKTFLEDLAHARKIIPEHLGRRGWFSRFIGFLTRPFQNQF